MNRQIYCKHYETESRKTSVYTYSLIGLDINCCNKCEKKLRKQIIDQDKIEKESKEEVEKWKNATRKLM